MPHVINSRALTGEKPVLTRQFNSRAVNARLCNFQYARTGATASRDVYILPCPRTGIIRAISIRATSVKRRNKIVQEITRQVANVSSFYAIIAIEHGFSMH